MLNPAAPDAGARLESRVRRAGAVARSACFRPCITCGSTTRRSTPCSRRRPGIGAQCSCTAACCRSASERSSDCRARSTCGSGDPLAVAAVAVRHPGVPVIIPHFGGGLFREALMAARRGAEHPARHVELEQLDSHHPGLTLRDVFARALDCRRSGAVAVRHGLVLFPARLAAWPSTTTQREIAGRA